MEEAWERWGLQFLAGNRLQLQLAPFSWESWGDRVYGGGLLSEALIGAVICISFNGFIWLCLLPFLCFPRVAFGINVSFEYFSITQKREGGIPPLLLYSDDS